MLTLLERKIESLPYFLSAQIIYICQQPIKNAHHAR